MITSTFKKTLSSTVLAAGFAAVATSAYAEGVACSCVLPETEVLATVTDVAGQVLVSSPSGFIPAEAGVVLSSNSRLLSGPESNATVAAGADCSVAMQSNSRLSIVPQEGGMCVKTVAILDDKTVRVSSQGEEAVGAAVFGEGASVGIIIGVGAVGAAVLGSGGSSSP